MRSISPIDILCGSQITPPLAPPKGMLTTAHFQVIQLARARTSSSVTSGAVADAAFSRAARNRMLDAESGEDLEAAVIHLHRDVDREFAIGITQNPPKAVIKIELLGSQVKARPLRFPGIAFFIDVAVGRSAWS